MNTDYYPFILDNTDGQFAVVADLEDLDLIEQYIEAFEEHDYTGNGYCWEGHIVQILEQTAPDLLALLEFDPEEGMLYVFAASAAAQQRFLSVIVPVFNDMALLDSYIAAADRARIEE